MQNPFLKFLKAYIEVIEASSLEIIAYKNSAYMRECVYVILSVVKSIFKVYSEKSTDYPKHDAIFC